MTVKVQPILDEYPYHANEEEMNAIDIEGAQEFVDANPNFYCIDANQYAIRVRLLGYPLTRRNLEIAFAELRKEGRIVERPAPEADPQPEVSKLGFKRLTTEEKDELIEQGRALQAHRDFEQAELRSTSPIPTTKFNRGSRNVAPISPKLQEAYRSEMATHAKATNDLSYERRVRDARFAVMEKHPDLDRFCLEFRRLVSVELANGDN